MRNQTYRNIEIIIIDKQSRDKTVEIAKRQGAKVFVMRAKERSQQINLGIKKAQGKYVYRVGSDFILDSIIIQEAVEKCENYSYDAICIHNTSDPTISIWSKIRKFERDMYRDDELNVAARFVKKSIYEFIGGLDEDLVAGEDYDFHNKLMATGYKIGRINAQEIHIGEPRSLEEIIRKHYYYGTTLKPFLKKNRRKGIKQLSLVRPAFIRHWREFLINPTLVPGFVVYEFVRYFSALLGYLT